jgi:hypothetical protein
MALTIEQINQGRANAGYGPIESPGAVPTSAPKTSLASRLGLKPSISRQRQIAIREGQPVSVNPNKVKPSAVGGFIRDTLRPMARIPQTFIEGVGGAANALGADVDTKGLSGKYLGEVKSLPGPLSEEVQAPGGFAKGILQPVGVGTELASNIIGGGAGGSVVKQGFKGMIKKGLKTGFVGGLETGFTYGLGNSLGEGKSATETAVNTAVSTLGGAIAGPVLSTLGVAGGALARKAIPRTEKELVSQFSKAQENVIKHYRNALPLTPSQKAKEMNLLKKTGDDVYTTLTKHRINVGSDEAPLQLREISDQFKNITEEAQKNENAYFNLDETLQNASNYIDDKLQSESARKTAKAKIENEITDLLEANPNLIIQGEDGNIKIKSELAERIRKIGNSWTPFNASDPEKVGQSAGYALSNAIRDQVEKEGTFPAYRDANKEWGKIIHAQEVLGNIEKTGKPFRTPGGLSGSISRKILSGALGYHTGGVGGAVLAEIGSEYGARVLSNPELRTYFDRKIITKLQGSKPSERVIQRLANEIKDYIEKQSNLKQLPAPDYIPMGSETLPVEQSSVQIIPAKKNPVSVNPKTNKFQTSYSTNVDAAPMTKQSNMTPSSNMSSTIQQKKSKVNEVINTLKNDIKNNGQRGSAEVFTNKGDLTTKILKDLEGKTTVSKQYILDATNRGELKQVERDITRQVLDTMKSDTINVKEFADKVKSELLPLKLKKNYNANYPKSVSEGGVPIMSRTKFESISLPSEIRGNVKNYDEHLWESPIKTSAGQTHFPNEGIDNYFGHTRIEDMADNKTRRVIEVQSDLYQKGNLAKEGNVPSYIPDKNTPAFNKKYQELEKQWQDLQTSDLPRDEKMPKMSEIRRKQDSLRDEFNAVPKAKRESELAKLQQYNDPTAHFRMIREEIKKASQDGKTKLQFPTGETAMKIEGLGETPNWRLISEDTYADGTPKRIDDKLEIADLETGKTVMQGGNDWIITDVLGDGKFKAVPKQKWDDMDAGVFLYSGEEKRLNELWGKNQSTLTQAEKAERDALFAKADQLKESFQFNREIPDTEQFDISGKVDTNNPIYKFYEKEVQKYLNKFGGKRVVDDKGVSWIEIPITKEQGKAPVEAFGKAKIGVVGQVAGATAVGVAGANVYNRKKK